jgi:hypothetical protein
MPGFFRGVFAATQQPEIHGFCIVNTMDRPPGQHWLGLYRESGQSVLYDSFGRAAGQGDLQHFEGFTMTEPDAEQPISRDLQQDLSRLQAPALETDARGLIVAFGRACATRPNSCVLLAPRTAALMCSSHRKALPVVTSFAVSRRGSEIA